MKSSKVGLVTWILASILLFSCKSGEKTPIDIQHNEVMAIHDEVMPKMRDIYKLKKRLKKSPQKDLEVVQNSISQLEKADDAMMDWMADYKKPKGDDPNALNYLASEMNKIEIVKSTMLIAISNAENILASNE